MRQIIDFIINIDKNIVILLENYGIWASFIIFLVIFVETGLVIIPFLPGDSLLFIVGTYAAKGGFNIFLIYPLLILAAVLGDSLNYYLGHKIGRKAFKNNRLPLINHNYLAKTELFYEKHGGKTIILARFIPIVRTFAPFVAGIGKMKYREFLSYNIIGGVLWVTIFVFGGFLFGNIPVVKNNFELVVIAIILLSVLPPIYEYIITKKKRNNEKV
ncbi:MAG: DedA family protein [bacterium]